MAEEPPPEVPPPEGEDGAEPPPVELPPPCIDLTDFQTKIDFFDNMVVIDDKSEKIEGANNFRQVSGFPVFGTGQTTEEGFLKVLDKVKALHPEGEGEKLLWFNMRKEPVIYINGNPFAPRNPEDLHRNLDISYSVEELNVLEAHYTNILKAKAAEKEGVLRTMKDQAFAENPMDREAVGEDTKVSLTEYLQTSYLFYSSIYLKQVENMKGQFEILNSLKENGFENLNTFRSIRVECTILEAGFTMQFTQQNPGDGGEVAGRGLFRHDGGGTEERAGQHTLRLLRPDGPRPHHRRHDRRLPHQGDPDHHRAQVS